MYEIHKKNLIVRNNLQDVRLSRGLSQKDLASMVGSTVATIDAIESGDFVCSVYLGFCLSSVLGVPFEVLFFLDREV